MGETTRKLADGDPALLALDPAARLDLAACAVLTGLAPSYLNKLHKYGLFVTRANGFRKLLFKRGEVQWWVDNGGPDGAKERNPEGAQQLKDDQRKQDQRRQRVEKTGIALVLASHLLGVPCWCGLEFGHEGDHQHEQRSE